LNYEKPEKCDITVPNNDNAKKVTFASLDLIRWRKKVFFLGKEAVESIEM